MNKTKFKIIALLLILVILLPAFITLLNISLLTNPVAAEKNNDTNFPWLKGLILITVSYFTNYFLGETPETKKESIVIEEPIIEEKEETNKNQESEEKSEEKPEKETETEDKKNNNKIGDNKIVEPEKDKINERNDKKEARKEDRKESPREIMGFYVNWVTQHGTSLKTLRQNHDKIDLIAPFWYTVQTNGNLKQRYGGPEEAAVKLARKNDIPIYPLINNSQTNNNILLDPQTRNKAINNIVSLLEKNDFAGVNIDFEFIPPSTRKGYTTFVRKLSEKLQARGKKITISVFPKINVPYEIHGAYDYNALADHVDRMVIMSYDHHWSTGSPGPIAPIDWVEKNIKYALKHVPAEKIILGIANYGYDWARAGQGEDLGSVQATELAESYNSKIMWDEESRTPYFHYHNGETTREVWFENTQSLIYKLDLVKKYNLQGVAVWRLGNENNNFWHKIEQNLR
ncbi:MAG: glycosyl hydrolase family 18 protein [Halanaerobiaceae bacterium]